MSTKRLRNLRGNRVFEIAEQLGLTKSSGEEESEYETDSESEQPSNDQNTQPITDTITEIIKEISDTLPQTESTQPSQITDEEKKKRNRNKKRAKKRRQQKQKKKKAQELAKKKSENKKRKNKQKSKKPNKTPPKSAKSNSQKTPKNTPNQTFEEKKEQKTQTHIIDDICSDWQLLSSDTRYFDPNFELKRKFGSIALEANDEYIPQNTHNKRHKKQERQLRKAMNKSKNNKFTHLHKHKIRLIKFNSAKWPQPYLHFSKRTGNVYMELINDERLKYFAFKYDKDYAQTQMEYKQRCAMFDPSQIAFLLRTHPYHVDTLLTMADILAKQGSLEESADMCERALFVLEKGLHSRFGYLTSNDCRLDYANKANQSFFVCLWKYSQNLGRRGCAHSAFEITKKLLCLAPLKDPLCVLLCLDYWALRAMEWQWICDFSCAFKCQIFDETNSEEMNDLRMYPNWCYSVAFAQYQIELRQSYNNSKQSKFGECDSGEVPMDLSAISGVSASVLMQQCILLFPEMIAPLLRKANERILGESEWMSVMGSEWFLKAKLRRSDNGILDKLCAIYSERAHNLWNNKDLLRWLCKHCAFVIERLANPLGFEIGDSGGELIEFEDLTVFDGIRDSVYGGNCHKNKNKNNKFHRLDVNEFSDVITTLPLEDMPDALMRPQRQRIDLEQLRHMSGEELNAIVDQLLHAGIELPVEIEQRLNQGQHLQNSNVLAAMLYSMMPWVNPIMANGNNQNQNEQKEDGGNENENKNDEKNGQ